MGEQKISFTIVVDDKGSVVFKQFGKNAEDSLGNVAKKSGSFTSMIKANWLEITAASATVYAGIKTIEKGMDELTLAAKALQAEESFGLMAKSAGENSEKLMKAMDLAAARTIDDSDMMQKAAKGLAQSLEGNDLIAISSAARIAARLSGEDVKTAYESITDSIANQMPKALKRYGLATKEQINLVNQLMAAGVRDIKMIDIVEANVADRMARYGELKENPAERLQRFKAEIQNVREEAAKGILLTIDVVYRFAKEGKGTGTFRGEDDLLGAVTEGNILDPKAFRQKITAQREMFNLEGERETYWTNTGMKDLYQKIQNAKMYADVLKETDASRIKIMESNAARETEITKMKTGDELHAEQIAIDKKKEINDAYYKFRLGEIAAEATAREMSEQYFDRTFFEKAQKGKLDADMKARKSETENAQIILNEKRYQEELTFEQNSMVMAVENENKARKDTIDRLIEIASIDQKRRDAEIDHASKMAVLGGRYGENGPGDLVRLDYLAQENKLLSERQRIMDEIRANDERLKPGMEGYDEWAKQKPGKNAAIAQIDQDVKNLNEQRDKAMVEFGNDWAGGFATGLKVYTKQIGSEFQIWEQMAKDNAQGMQTAMSDYYFDAITLKFQSFGDLMTNIGRSWGRALSDAMAKETMKIFIGSDNGAGGGMSVFSQFASWGLGLLGIGGRTSPGTMTPGMESLEGERDAYFSSLPGRAKGGPVTAQRPYWVGEKGVPELFVPETDGTIIPQAALAGAGSSGGWSFSSTNNVLVPGLTQKQLADLHGEMERAALRVVESYVERHM